jgi:hypothetical protein
VAQCTTTTVSKDFTVVTVLSAPKCQSVQDLLSQLNTRAKMRSLALCMVMVLRTKVSLRKQWIWLHCGSYQWFTFAKTTIMAWEQAKSEQVTMTSSTLEVI